MRHLVFVFCVSLLATLLLAGSAIAMFDADNACNDQLKAVGGPDGASGKVLSSAFSEAGPLVMLEDGGGTVCHVGIDHVSTEKYQPENTRQTR